MQALDYTRFEHGLRSFVRLIPLRRDSTQAKYIQDEFDLFSAIDCLEQYLNESAEMFGKQKYRDTPFDFCEDIQLDLAELFLNHENQQKAAVLRKKNQPIYHLVLCVILDLLRTYPHGDVLMHAQEIFKEIRERIANHNYDGGYDDALVMQEIIYKEIREKEAARQAKIVKRRKRHEAMLEEIVELSFE